MLEPSLTVPPITGESVLPAEVGQLGGRVCLDPLAALLLGHADRVGLHGARLTRTCLSAA